MRTENAAPWMSFPEDVGSGICAVCFVENGVSASKPQWETPCHTYISMVYDLEEIGPSRRIPWHIHRSSVVGLSL